MNMRDYRVLHLKNKLKLYCCSKFTSLSNLANEERNSYPQIGVKHC